MNIGLIDYGLSNLYSVESALKYLNLKFEIIKRVENTQSNIDLIIIPGVSSFGAGMQSLRFNGQADLIKEHFNKGKPILGLCFGAQILLESSEESPGVSGLNFVPGSCLKLKKSNFRIPNQGWRELLLKNNYVSIFSEFTDKSQYGFFSHSYKMEVKHEPSVVMVTSSSSENITAAYEYNNIFGIQFHPERSGIVGLNILNKVIQRLGFKSE